MVIVLKWFLLLAVLLTLGVLFVNGRSFGDWLYAVPCVIGFILGCVWRWRMGY